jgi:hypothetical protein
MAQPQEPHRAKLFAGVLTGSEELLPEVKEKLEELFGRTDLESETMLFDSTYYYEPQMGAGLKRKFYSFEKLVEQELLAEAKISANGLEEQFSGRLEVERPVNIDPGLLLPSKMILASCKNFSHRIYLGRGVYGEITLQYADGSFRVLPWTFPDYRLEEYHAFFATVRNRYMSQLKAQR